LYEKVELFSGPSASPRHGTRRQKSAITKWGTLSFLWWCSFRVKRIAIISWDFSVLVTVELAQAESKPCDLSKNGRPAHLGASGNLVLTN
jgi:hypothetical protein